METDYLLGKHKATLTYGETFTSKLRKEAPFATHVVLIANQRYYDLFAEKISHAFTSETQLDWYICRNDAHCNNLTELEGLLSFFEDIQQQAPFLLIGLGNEGVLQLTAFLNETMASVTNCWLVPVSIQALSQALLPITTIEWQNKPALRLSSQPEQILFDITLTNRRGPGKLVDLIVFIRCGLVGSHEFLQALYSNFPDEKRLNQRSFNGILDKLLLLYEESGEQITKFGSPFELAFLTTENGHLLSEPMKRLLGLLLQLLWCQQQVNFEFHFKNFVIWLIRLGYPVTFPEELFLSDYAEEVLKQVAGGNSALLLTAIGEVEGQRVPTAEEILQTVEKYKEILNEIRG